MRMFAIKAEVSDPWAETFAFSSQKTMYGGKHIAKGASLKDPARLFNSSLDGNARRAIDIHEGGEVDESAFKALVRQAAVLNSSGKSKSSKKAKS